MSIEPTTLPVRSGEDVVKVRQAVRTLAMDLGFSLVDQTKVITAASELARNTLTYGGGGEVRIERLNQGPKRAGVRLTFEDRGPGISNIDLALTDGFTTGNGLGLGLNGARKLSHEFDIWSQPGVGTRVTITRWK
ncbi:anti-sigma regulatory factor [Steroidobacter agaridevorans]|uniref:Anti-sigma regulatory factor n=1 Tax=Steroidobacter agaridevorans TaxID=2695856 RepID=A0A829YF33_9GAMM|nr:anti-sigma regulatory factor [Steroidobacter agaridevorans]GFE81458.1 anti-sigma regulatory factor [Steroidobacter agaridevorans]GFE88660.1 anti-sigma regulatory factor [Steroidobacter agaridevorans]